MDLCILKADPFVTVDQQGVGMLMRMAISQTRAANHSIKIGVCGEHAGDPASIEFFQSLGVDYLSCSPARILAVRLAASQAVLKLCDLVPTCLSLPAIGVALGGDEERYRMAKGRLHDVPQVGHTLAI